MGKEALTSLRVREPPALPSATMFAPEWEDVFSDPSQALCGLPDSRG